MSKPFRSHNANPCNFCQWFDKSKKACWKPKDIGYCKITRS